MTFVHASNLCLCVVSNVNFQGGKELNRRSVFLLKVTLLLFQLLVAEQNGNIRLYETSTYQPIMSLNSLHVTGDLMACDWSILNPMKVGAVVGKHWVVWDVSKAR